MFILVQNNRSPVAIPEILFRDNVEPNKGGKVPEAAHMRIEINKLDAAGLQSEEGRQMLHHLMQAAPTLPDAMGVHPNDPGRSVPRDPFFDDFPSNFPFHPVFDSAKLNGNGPSSPSSSFDSYQGSFNSVYDDPFSSSQYPNEPSDYSSPGYTPPLKLKPDYVPHRESAYQPAGYGAPEPYAPNGYGAPEPSYGPAGYGAPEPSYAPAGYGAPEPYAPTGYGTPEPYAPTGYGAPEPAGYGAPEPYAPPKPVGPVLLEKRPYEVHSVQALPVTVEQSYTEFDCRTVPYPDRHYADIEAGCEVILLLG